jgi:D-glycero-D-manno-heptose 1,7-bisphosphate phosphatase
MRCAGGSGRVRSAVFLDRDGTINAMVCDADHGVVDSPATPEQFQLLPGAAEAIRRINEAGLLAVVVSNQPGIAKGRFRREHLDAVTDKMTRKLAAAGARLDAVYYCLHHPEAVVEGFQTVCDCRKPKPGLLIRAGQELQIDLAHSFMIGDGLNDIQAGAAAGCRTIWIGRVRCDLCEVMGRANIAPDAVAATLIDAVESLLRGRFADGDLSRLGKFA